VGWGCGSSYLAGCRFPIRREQAAGATLLSIWNSERLVVGVVAVLIWFGPGFGSGVGDEIVPGSGLEEVDISCFSFLVSCWLVGWMWKVEVI
jgi:hypothetical protein